ncbi:MAG: Spx/MgsR family RNA polymerase-binding regulatory protein [Acidobacteria bacterium]|nr:Spx/MgsR family RNA polymerase-binding regulatory protein [Acidobacteriota bacterium]
MSSIEFYWKSTCSTCRNARNFLLTSGVSMKERDLAKKPFTKVEISALVARRDIFSFINPKSTPYKALGLKDKNLTEEEAINLLAQEVNLFKRPFIIKGDMVLFGFSLAEYQKLIE